MSLVTSTTRSLLGFRIDESFTSPHTGRTVSSRQGWRVSHSKNYERDGLCCWHASLGKAEKAIKEAYADAWTSDPESLSRMTSRYLERLLRYWPGAPGAKRALELRLAADERKKLADDDAYRERARVERLNAAAPAMLDALKHARAVIIAQMGTDDCGPVRTIDAALAQARGDA